MPMETPSCRFCRLTARAAHARASVDRPVLASTHFEVIPTVGPLVAGWLLVVPKCHYLCLAALPGALLQELEAVTQECVSILRRRYAEVVAFEHGPAAPRQPSGCGVDHAHLHLVPTGCDLRLGAANAWSEQLLWRGVENVSSALEAHSVGLPYLYIQDQSGERFVAAHASIPSQLFRRVIAESVGVPERFDWRRFPEYATVERTLQALGNLGDGERGRTTSAGRLR